MYKHDNFIDRIFSERYTKHYLLIGLFLMVYAQFHLREQDNCLPSQNIGEVLKYRSHQIESMFISLIKVTLISAIKLTKILSKIQKISLKKNDPHPVVYKTNFASMFGGATITMKDHDSIGLNNILIQDNDKYMYTSDELPISFVVALKEEIAIEQISVKSREMYSSIVKDFMVQGSFSFPNSNWTILGNFKAANHFKEQLFSINTKVVRYLKFTMISKYGGWKYFTLTQIKVYGKSIFANAADEIKQNQQATAINDSMEKEYMGNDNQSCPNDIELILPQQQSINNNVIVELHKQIQKLQKLNINMREQLQSMKHKHSNLSRRYEEHKKEKLKYNQSQIENLIQSHQIMSEQIQSLAQFRNLLYLGLVFITLLILVCIFFIYTSSHTEEKSKVNKNKEEFLKINIKQYQSKRSKK